MQRIFSKMEFYHWINEAVAELTLLKCFQGEYFGQLILFPIYCVVCDCRTFFSLCHKMRFQHILVLLNKNCHNTRLKVLAMWNRVHLYLDD